jgi:DnaJ-class molecular chaperone
VCGTCFGKGRQYEIYGSVRVVKPCPNCTNEERENRKKESFKKLLENIERVNKKLKRMEGESSGIGREAERVI